MNENISLPSISANGLLFNLEKTQFQKKSDKRLAQEEHPFWKKVKKNSAKNNQNGLNKNEGNEIAQNVSAIIPGQKKSNLLSNYFNIQNNVDSIEDVINPISNPFDATLTPNLEERKNIGLHLNHDFKDNENSDLNFNSNRSFHAELESNEVNIPHSREESFIKENKELKGLKNDLNEEIAINNSNNSSPVNFENQTEILIEKKEIKGNISKENLIKEILTKAENIKSKTSTPNGLYHQLWNSNSLDEKTKNPLANSNHIDSIKSIYLICKKCLKRGKYESTLNSFIYLENNIFETLLLNKTNLSFEEINQLGQLLIKIVKKENKILTKSKSFKLIRVREEDQKTRNEAPLTLLKNKSKWTFKISPQIFRILPLVLASIVIVIIAYLILQGLKN